MGLALMHDKGQACPGCVAASSRAAAPRRVGPIVWLATLGIVLVALAVSACGPKQPSPTDTSTPTDTMTQIAPTDAPSTEPGPATTGELPVTKPTGYSATNLAEMAYQFKSNKWLVLTDNGQYYMSCGREITNQADSFYFVPKADGTVEMTIYGSSGIVRHTFASEKEAATSMSYFSKMTCLKY